MKEYKTILFDLDGTLTDPGEGITNSVAYALKKFGIEVDDKKKLYCFIGPPLLYSFTHFYNLSEEDSQKALAYYREYYADKGIFENRIYDGMMELLADLKKGGRKLVVATSKPEHFAKTVLDNFDITQYFDYISGATLDEKRVEKTEIIDYAIKELSIDLSSAVMIGDRKFDIDGAHHFGIDSIGVLFGYGGYDELKKSGATYIVKNVDEIRKILL